MAPWYPTPDTVAVRCPASKDGGTGRRTYPAGGVALRETHPLLGELVEIGCLDDRMPVTGEVSPAQVVGQEYDKVGRLILGLHQAGEDEAAEKGKQFSVHLYLRLEFFISFIFWYN